MSFVLIWAIAGCSTGSTTSNTLPSMLNEQQPAQTNARFASAAIPLTANYYTAIDCGGTATGKWLADNAFNNGSTSSYSGAINTSKVTDPAPQSVYQTQRYGAYFSYVIGALTPGQTYTVRLHFVESYFSAAGHREFNVTMNNTHVLTNFDIFKVAGGANVAVIEQFSTTADKNGIITIGFSATINNATIAGIEVESGSGGGSPSPAPTPTPNASGPYPIYSSYFKGNTPFHHTVSSLMAAGAIVQSRTIAQHYWAQGIGTAQPFNSDSGLGALYLVHSGDPGYVFSCPAYGTCNVSGKVVHYPRGAVTAPGSDHHIVSIDPVYLDAEVDGWGGYGPANERCNLDAGSPNGYVTCSWGGIYPFSGSGLANPSGNSGTAGGYALGLITITAQELLQGHIDHALGISQSCLDNGGIYPSAVGRTTDAGCPSNLEPNAVYGSMIHLKAGVNLTQLSSNRYCQTILTALQTYGAYTSDNNGSYGIALITEMPDEPAYASSNPWIDTIFPSMLSTGDATGTASGPIYFKSCLQNVPAADIEVISISENLP